MESHKLVRFLAHACLQKMLQNKLARVSFSIWDIQRKTPELENQSKCTSTKKRAEKSPKQRDR